MKVCEKLRQDVPEKTLIFLFLAFEELFISIFPLVIKICEIYLHIMLKKYIIQTINKSG